MPSIAFNDFGVWLQNNGHHQYAIDAFKTALEIDHNYPEAHNNLAIGYYTYGNFKDAIAHYLRSIELNKNFAEAYSNLAGVLADQGNSAASINCLQKALNIKPDFAVAHNNLIVQMDLSPAYTEKQLQDERRVWAARHTMQAAYTHTNNKDGDRKLRIGYVSADFREHSAPTVFSAMLHEYDRQKFDVFAYYNNLPKDEMTDAFKRSVTEWRDIAHLSTQDVANLIKDDGIDILVDLSGHSSGNRLDVFALKPAPIQISAWGYIGGTGLPEMDYIFADRIIVPEEEQSLYMEEVVYLSSAINAYFDGVDFPEIKKKSDVFTFGSFNRLGKLSNDTFLAWTEILKAVPDSKLLLKCHELEDESTRDFVRSRFVGIDPDRIELLGRTSWTEHVETFNRVDIALDPFPHGGGVTTLEGLMMNVPVVTLRWPTHVGRLSASILSNIGLDDWIAETKEKYVDLAISKAKSQFEFNGRKNLLNSIVGNSQLYVNEVESIYQVLWKRYCNNSRQSVSIA